MIILVDQTFVYRKHYIEHNKCVVTDRYLLS